MFGWAGPRILRPSDKSSAVDKVGSKRGPSKGQVAEAGQKIKRKMIGAVDPANIVAERRPHKPTAMNSAAMAFGLSVEEEEEVEESEELIPTLVKPPARCVLMHIC